MLSTLSDSQNCFGNAVATTSHSDFDLTQTNTCADTSPQIDPAREDYPSIYGTPFSIKDVEITDHGQLLTLRNMEIKKQQQKHQFAYR